MQFQIHQRYLNLPVKNGATLRRVSLSVEGQLVREFDIELATGGADFWAFLDLSPWIGKTATLALDSDPTDWQAFPIHQTEGPEGGENLYRERLRSQFHFTSRRGWNNDPNGLLFYRGEYHLFYQHNPYGTKWGNMHWGHAVSRDLVRWRELPDALYPDELGTMFSGSGVVDWENTTGFGNDDVQALVLVYTAAGGSSALSAGKGFAQCLAYSNDRGHTWTKWTGNPMLPEIVGGNRDPKVIWHTATQQWIIALYLEGNRFALFASPDLKDWRRIFDYTISGSSECPDIFELSVDGNPQDTRWILWAADSSYLIGHFDGESFIQESLVSHSHRGGNSYAAQTWSNIPAEDGRRIQISWLQVDVPGMPFNQGMTFPVSLRLRTTADGLRIFFEPVREIEALYQAEHKLEAQALRPAENPLARVTGECFDLQVELVLGTAEEVGLVLRGVPLVYATRQQMLTCLGKSVPLAPVKGRIRLRVLVDRTSLEIFGNDGEVYLPLGVVLEPHVRTVDAFARGGEAWIEGVCVYELASIWQ